MLKKAPVELKSLVLLEFVRTLVISKNPLVFLAQEKKELKKTKKEKFVEKIKTKIPKELPAPIQIMQRGPPLIHTLPKIPNKPLRVPPTRLPPQFAYLRPGATKDVPLNLGPLNDMMADPSIRKIEANGPGQQIIVEGKMGRMPTATILTKEDIDKIIKIFSLKSKIPIGQGVTKIVLGTKTLSAIVSPEGTKFTIEKTPLAPPRAPSPATRGAPARRMPSQYRKSLKVGRPPQRRF